MSEEEEQVLSRAEFSLGLHYLTTVEERDSRLGQSDNWLKCRGLNRLLIKLFAHCIDVVQSILKLIP
jgi:hypothetical protein